MGKKGSVLMISLWILAILVIFALGLGHRAAINLRLAKYQRDRLKATCLAKAGINRAIAELKKDAEKDAADPDTQDYDSLNDSWANNGSAFKDILINESETEFASVSYKTPDKKELIYGVRDEERKININSASKDLLVALFKDKEANIAESDAQEITNYILIWRGEVNSDDDKFKDFKKAPFAYSEELIVILEYFYHDKNETEYTVKAQEVFNKIKDLVTLYGDNDNKVNINTASTKVLEIIFKSVALEPINEGEITGLANMINGYASANNYFTNEDLIEDPEDKLNIINKISNTTLYQSGLIKNNIDRFKVVSENFRIESQGKVGNITKNITAIYDRGTGKIVYWHEN